MRGNLIYIWDACSLAQTKGLSTLIYHKPALEVRFVRGAAGTTSFFTIREAIRCSWQIAGITTAQLWVVRSNPQCAGRRSQILQRITGKLSSL
jgi:hypothetical protein